MRRLFLELFHKQIFPSTPITSFFPFLSYIVVTPLMIGFEKHFSCHSHLGPIRIPPLFPFPPEPFPRNEKEDGTLELYYLSAYCLPKILLLQLVGHRVIQISRVFRGFPMLQLPYQFDRSGMDRLNIPLGSPVLTLLCGIHSRSALGITSSSGWNSSQNPTTSPTSLPLTVSRTSIETEWFHVPSSIGYSSPFVSPSPISVSIISQDWMAKSLKSLDSIVFQECWAGYVSHVSGRNLKDFRFFAPVLQLFFRKKPILVWIIYCWTHWIWLELLASWALLRYALFMVLL